jgi:ppGpp synthetase/RelA/SpoT-type nucleotidyltranferase
MTTTEEVQQAIESLDKFIEDYSSFKTLVSSVKMLVANLEMIITQSRGIYNQMNHLETRIKTNETLRGNLTEMRTIIGQLINLTAVKSLLEIIERYRKTLVTIKNDFFRIGRSTFPVTLKRQE